MLYPAVHNLGPVFGRPDLAGVIVPGAAPRPGPMVDACRADDPPADDDDDLEVPEEACKRTQAMIQFPHPVLATTVAR